MTLSGKSLSSIIWRLVLAAHIQLPWFIAFSGKHEEGSLNDGGPNKG